MEQWEAIIERPLEQGHRAFEKVLQTAASVLNNAETKLAPFETEWVLETLLFAPVNLLCTVSERRADDVWRKAVADALKLLAAAADAGIAGQHSHHIADLCMLSYEPGLRSLALQCLSAVWRGAEPGAEAARHVAALHDASQCRAPLALLVGVLCEHHPTVVADDVTNIWRGFLNMLDNKNNTDTVIKAVLEGIRGLFRHFGDHLPTAELQAFYDDISQVYMQKPACQTVCFNILRDHAALFRERIERDRALRMQLWGAAPTDTVVAVYAVTAQTASKEVLDNILATEVLPHTAGGNKMAALRALAACGAGPARPLDLHALEYTLREKVARADADLVLWSVEYGLPNSDRLLQASIMFYENLPSAARREILATGIVKSPPDVKRAAIQFLISQYCEDLEAPVWRELNDDVLQAVAQELADCVDAALEAVPDDEDLPPKLLALLRLASKVSGMLNAPLCTYAPLALSCARAGTGLDAAEMYKSIRIDQCRDEATLQEACLALVHAPDEILLEPAELLAAVQIIVTSEVGPAVHGAALRKFDYLLSSDQCRNIDISYAIRAVEKLRTRGDRTDKHIRILHREVTMFLGKHGNVDVNNNTDSFDDVVEDLKDTLALSLPYQGTVFKVSLRSLLLVSLRHEQPPALIALLTVLCANLSSKKEVPQARAAVRVSRALAAAHASGARAHTAQILQALRLCCDAACAGDILQYISATKSCGVRKLLSAGLAVLCEDAAILQLTVERTYVMLASSDSNTTRAGLDVAETLLTILENNNSLSETTLPELITLIAKTYESDTKTVFNVASKTFIDKQELFGRETIRKIVHNLLESVLNTNISDANIYRTTVNNSMRFIKNLRVDLDEILDLIFDIKRNHIDVKMLYVLAALKSEFGFDVVVSRRVLERDRALINYLLELGGAEMECFIVDAILRFVEEYCEVALEIKYTEIINLLSQLITTLSPNTVRKLSKNINTCFSTLRKHLKTTPQPIITSFRTWLEMQPIKKLTEAIERDSFLNEHKIVVESLKIMSNVFDVHLVSHVKTYIQNWPMILLKLYSNGRLEQYNKERKYFVDILTVSLKFLTPDDVKKILKAADLNQKNLGVLFCGNFDRGFFEVLTQKPFLLLDEDVRECSVVLNDVVRVMVKSSRGRCDDVLELVDELWPTYVQHTNFSQRHSLLTNMEYLPKRLSPESKPLQWAVQAVCGDATLDEKIKLLCILPEESFKSPEVMTAVSSVFPARLRELRPGLLDAVAARPSLLRLVTALADDESTGWWDEALESCLTAVAKRNDIDLCTDVFNRCRSERVCERVLIPLLRHSSTELCEKFLATVLSKILGSLSKKPRGGARAACERYWDECMISLHMLLIAFEKLPTWSLESPTSVLHGGGVPPWHLVREACRLVDSLRETGCPSGADDRLRTKYRRFQCMLFNCLSGGIARRRPGAPLYARLFHETALAKIVDEDLQYELPIRASWSVRNKTVHVAVPPETSLSPSHTQRSRIFLRTLSENPMLFDLHSAQEEQVVEVQDITVRESALNSHPCAGTLSALVRQVAATPALAAVWAALSGALLNGGRNLRWLIAQIICNSKEELKPLASELQPGLLAVLSGTVAGKRVNGLHLDVLETILFWKEDTTSPELSTIAHHLITTCLEYRRGITFDTVIKSLNGFLELYKEAIQIAWTSFEPYYEDQNPDTQKALLQLLKLVSKYVYVPESLSKILGKFDLDPSKMAECFGRALAAAGAVEGREGERGAALGAFRRVLEKCAVTTYVRALYYASLGCVECCGEKEFRRTMDYVSQVTSHDRTKCLHVLSAYLSRGCHSQYIADMFELVDLADMVAKDHAALLVVKAGLPKMEEALRRRCVSRAAALTPPAAGARVLVVGVMRTACEELFAQPPQPPAKRQKTDTTRILSILAGDSYGTSVLTGLGLGAVDCDAGVASAARDALAPILNKDLGIRFAECFLLTMYLPAHTDRALSVCACVSALLVLLLSDLRSGELFRNTRLKDEPLPTTESAEPPRLLTLSRTFQGTFSSYGGTRRRPQPEDTSKPAIDVQVPIDSILESLLEFAKTTPEAARALLIECLRSVLSTSAFDISAALVPQLGTLLRLPPSELTPVYIDVCRMLIAQSSTSVDCLLPGVSDLRALTSGSEGASLAHLLYEEVSMHCLGEQLFWLGVPDEDCADVTMDATTTFSIEDLKSAFGKLSCWEDITLQQRRVIRNSLPPLWTDRSDFVSHVYSYEVPTDTECWFDKMAAAFKQEMGPNSVRWLQRMDQWPRKHFEISAITEASSWHHEVTETMPTQLFRASDCLAECAARLMLRSAYYNLQYTESDKVSRLSRSHELELCARANEMALPQVALRCVDRNSEELCKRETLPWLRQKLLAVRQLALERHDTTLLHDALEKAKEYTPEYSTDAAVSIEMFHLMLLLHKDLESLTNYDLQTILVQVNESAQQVDWSRSSKKALSSTYELAMAHYDECADSGAMDMESALTNMAAVFCQAAGLNVGTADMLLTVLLTKLADYEGQLDEHTSQQLLEKVSPLAGSLDSFDLELLQANSHKLQARVPAAAARDERWRRCLQLVCDPRHLLLQYCEDLRSALRDQDGARWKNIQDSMRHKIYENPYAGPSFKLLDKYKEVFNSIYEFEPSSDYAHKAAATLASVIAKVQQPPQPTLRLADLCPALRAATAAGAWLGLQHATVVKFHDKVHVFTDSIRRPVILSMLLSNGKTHRVLLKTGERLADDAAAQYIAGRMQRLCGGRDTSYTVTLLDEESAVIEYLEGYERLRALIESTCDLNVAVSVSRPADQHLVQSAAAALRAHHELCSKIPARALRTAIERNSSCVEDFITKRRNFTDSLADMTLLTWLLGAGDRHLQNILCGAGRLRGVDWGLRGLRGLRGARGPRAEPPARLTRTLLALADNTVLIARMQGGLSALGARASLLLAAARACAGPDTQTQLQRLRDILSGVTSSYDVTRDVTDDGYLQLLDNELAHYRDRAHYSVEDQVACLVRQCTAPSLLAVVRAGWEPWL